MKKTFALICYRAVIGSDASVHSERESVLCVSDNEKKLHSYLEILNRAAKLLDSFACGTYIRQSYSIKIVKSL